MRIERKEAEFALVGMLIIIGWFLFIRVLIAPFLESIYPFLAMLIYQSGLYAGLLLMSGILSNGKKKTPLSRRIQASTIVFLIFIAVDIVAPPYMVRMDGIINTGPELWYVSSDAGFGSLYQLFLPSWAVWFMTYPFTAILLGVLIPIVVATPKQIKKALAG